MRYCSNANKGGEQQPSPVLNQGLWTKEPRYWDRECLLAGISVHCWLTPLRPGWGVRLQPYSEPLNSVSCFGLSSLSFAKCSLLLFVSFSSYLGPFSRQLWAYFRENKRPMTLTQILFHGLCTFWLRMDGVMLAGSRSHLTEMVVVVVTITPSLDWLIEYRENNSFTQWLFWWWLWASIAVCKITLSQNEWGHSGAKVSLR